MGVPPVHRTDWTLQEVDSFPPGGTGMGQVGDYFTRRCTARGGRTSPYSNLQEGFSLRARDHGSRVAAKCKIGDLWRREWQTAGAPVPDELG